jgi:hypothetical protein
MRYLESYPGQQSPPFLKANSMLSTTQIIQGQRCLRANGPHAFFVEMFGLHPLSRTDENNEAVLDFASEDGREETGQIEGASRSDEIGEGQIT